MKNLDIFTYSYNFNPEKKVHRGIIYLSTIIIITIIIIYKIIDLIINKHVKSILSYDNFFISNIENNIKLEMNVQAYIHFSNQSKDYIDYDKCVVELQEKYGIYKPYLYHKDTNRIKVAFNYIMNLTKTQNFYIRFKLL